MSNTAKYVPALRFRALTRLYDPLVQLTLKDAKIRSFSKVGQRSERLSAPEHVKGAGCASAPA